MIVQRLSKRSHGEEWCFPGWVLKEEPKGPDAATAEYVDDEGYDASMRVPAMPNCATRLWIN
jgi:hypothetical protein